MKREIIVITGGNGTIAQTTQTYIMDNSNRYIVYAPMDYVLNVCNEDAVSKFFKEVGECILINCAGILKEYTIKDMTLSDWNEVINTNLTGYFLCAKYAILNGCTQILNVGSNCGLGGRNKLGAYCATKAAISSLTQTLRAEGTQATTLVFGRTNTNLRRKYRPDEDTSKSMSAVRVAEIILNWLNNDFANAEQLIFDSCECKLLTKI
jgi:NAD(P)-dependent dehydrogenase (short-subunit alcohol dehydrogenase family)